MIFDLFFTGNSSGEFSKNHSNIELKTVPDTLVSVEILRVMVMVMAVLMIAAES